MRPTGNSVWRLFWLVPAAALAGILHLHPAFHRAYMAHPPDSPRYGKKVLVANQVTAHFFATQIESTSPSLCARPAAGSRLKHVDHPYWTDDYDHHFKKYSKHYFGAGFDWRWFKAQAIAESNLRPRVKSKAGAKGLMQILPSTFAEIKKKNPHFKSIDNPRWNIAAGVYYDRQLYRRWSKLIDSSDRLPFVFGSYNAGFGGMRKAYRKALKKRNSVQRWVDVETYAPNQTRHYVRRIHRLMKKDIG